MIIYLGESFEHEMPDSRCSLSFNQEISDRARSVFIYALQKGPNAGGNLSNQNMVNNRVKVLGLNF